jgi:hypothetical protein
MRLVEVVPVIDGLNRFRFAGDPDLFAAWRAASKVVGPPRTRGQSLPREERGADGRTGSPSETPPGVMNLGGASFLQPSLVTGGVLNLAVLAAIEPGANICITRSSHTEVVL